MSLRQQNGSGFALNQAKQLPAANAPQHGFVLIVVFIALVATAGMIAVLQIVESSRLSFSMSKSTTVSLESFTQSVLELCPGIVSAARYEGEYKTTGLTSFNVPANSYGAPTMQVLDPNLGAELAVTSEAFVDWRLIDNGALQFQPDLVVQHGNFRGLLDVDIYVAPGTGRAGIQTTYINDTYKITAYGGLDAGSSSRDPSSFETFRCQAQGSDGQRTVDMYMFYRH